MEEVAHDEEFTSKMADGRLMRILGVSLFWWNDNGKIIKGHDYTKTVEK